MKKVGALAPALVLLDDERWAESPFEASYTHSAGLLEPSLGRSFRCLLGIVAH